VLLERHSSSRFNQAGEIEMPTKKSQHVVVAGFDDPNLSSPEYPDALNGTSGKIHRPGLDANNGLRFLMRTWGAPDDDDYATIEWSPDGIDTWTVLWTIHFPSEITTPTVERVIPMSLLNHGKYEFRYKVKNGIGGVYTDFSETSMADIDLFGPFKRLGSALKPPKVKFPDFIETSADIITQVVIDTNPEFTFEVLPYDDWESGDGVRYWFTQDNPADNGPPLNTLPIPAGGLEIDLPNTFFANPDVLDGIWFFVYQLIDGAGNVSELSRTEGRILKRSNGLILTPLIIRENTPDGLIDIPEWEANVVVAIPAYAYQPGDHVTIRWGSQSHGPIPLNGVFDFDITLPNQLILDEFGTSTEAVTTSATYEIHQNGGTDRPPTATDIDVNLWAPGPTPPLPGEENPDLGEVELMGPASDPVPNLLVKADFDAAGAIVARITLWTTPSPRMNDIIRVYWGSKSLQVGELTLGSEAPGAGIVIELDKTALATLGNDSHDLFYTVSEPDSLNGNLSPSTSVQVDDAIEHIMDPAEFRNVQSWSGDPRGRLNCVSVKGGPELPWTDRYLEVWIPPNSDYFKDGVDVIIEFHGAEGLNGDLPAIGSTTGSRTITLDETTAEQGFMFHYGPYVPFLKPIEGYTPPFASSWLRYSINHGGTWARSVPAVIPVRMYSANNTCDTSGLP
jgi:hypothetical protein